MSQQTSPGRPDAGPKEIWTESSLPKLVRLQPRLFKVFIDTRAHKIKNQLNIFCGAMGGEAGGEGDIKARELVQVWFDTAFDGMNQYQTDASASRTASELQNDIRHQGFFYTQRSLLMHKDPNKPLSFLNAYREQLGLTHVGSDHPSLVRPKLCIEWADWIERSKGRRKNQSMVKRVNKVGEKIKPQILRRGTPIKRNKKMARGVTPGLVITPGNALASDEDTDIWSDIPDEPPEPDQRDDPTGSHQSNGGIKAVEDSKTKVDSEPNVRWSLGVRSSTRLAIHESLKTQQQLESPLSPKPKPKKLKRSYRKRGSKSRTDSAIDKLETNESDSPSVDVPLKNCAHLYRTAETNTMHVDVQPPYPGPSLHHNIWHHKEKKPSLNDEALASDSALRPPLTNGAAPPAGILLPDEPSSNTWDDSYLTQYVRIPVWAKSRQELCELPYFKSMQGGVYTRGGTVYGYLLGRFPSPRDAWCHDGKLIISHGGGKHIIDEGENDPSKVRHHLGDDQLESDKSIRGLLTSYRMFRPIVILAEADYEHLQKFNLKQGYAKWAGYYALGHYAIVAAWAEREEDGAQGHTHTRWKFAFQYIEGDQGTPWWLQPPGASIVKPEPPGLVRVTQASGERRKFGGLVSGSRKRVFEITTESFTGVPSIGCDECSTLSPHVYTVGPICLNPDCSSFWKHNGLPVPQTELTFNPDFLKLRGLPEQLQKVPYPIVPEYPDWQHRGIGESIFNRHYWSGACCHHCGRVSCRQKWQCWECPTCGLRREESRPQIYNASWLFGPMDCEAQGGGVFSPHDMKNTSRVVRYHDGLTRLVVYYELPDDVGKIVHVLNHSRSTEKADQLFLQYQRDASNTNMFQRHAIKAHGVKGELYAQHYSHNAGAPYKYIAEAISTPFEECPESVVQARDHIQYLCEPALGKKVNFNEVLSVAYAEGQEMNFHSDDEPGLGPVIAGLTLGSHAEMIFRYHNACKKNLMYKNGPFRPSEARMNDDQDSNDRVLRITLSHGDLLIMSGTEIQKQYEHAVFVRDTDMVRFAATARLIHPHTTAPPVAHDENAGRHGHQESAYTPQASVSISQDIPLPLTVPDPA